VKHRVEGESLWSPVNSEENVRYAGPKPELARMRSFEEKSVEELDILPPVTPKNIVALAHNYHDLVEGPDPKEPLIFLKSTSTIIGHKENIIIPRKRKTWVEVELAIVIGDSGKNITKREASEYIRGYTIVNDVTTEGVYGRNWHLPRSKSRDTYCPTGPYLVQGLDTDSLKMQTRVNGNRTQHSDTSKRIYGDEKAVEDVSSVMELHEGDLLLTGTPAGATESTIQGGDIVEVEIENIGILRNRVVEK
jgi:2-keto-4-pentenoate hydratase/2-oxohepta-3-ene-1,7-dioic acid hydratase in catechol pathway